LYICINNKEINTFTLLLNQYSKTEIKEKPVHTGLYLVRIGMLRGCDNPFFFYSLFVCYKPPLFKYFYLLPQKYPFLHFSIQISVENNKNLHSVSGRLNGQIQYIH